MFGSNINYCVIEIFDDYIIDFEVGTFICISSTVNFKSLSINIRLIFFQLKLFTTVKEAFTHQELFKVFVTFFSFH